MEWRTIIRKVFYVTVPISCGFSGLAGFIWLAEHDVPLIGVATLTLTWLGAFCAKDMIAATLPPEQDKTNG